MINPHSAAPFPTTAWSMVRAAQNCDSQAYLAAMNRCIAAYWRPVFCFLRAKRYPFHRAEDLTQEFFLRFYERGWIARADQQRRPLPDVPADHPDALPCRQERRAGTAAGSI